MRLNTIERKRFRVRKKLKNVTLVSASSIDKEFKGQKKNKSELSTIVAEALAKKANEKNITLVSASSIDK